MAEQFRRQLDWEVYLASAKALGYTEREARLVVAGVYELARKIPQAVDVIAEAKAVLASGDLIPDPRR
jgi:hypothetical protein